MARTAAVILAFDYGLKRIGAAVGQTVTGSASPLGALANGPSGPDLEGLARLVREWAPDRLVVGLPLNADGSASDMSRAADAFARVLEETFGLPVARVDERHTSREAQAALKDARRAGNRRRVLKEHVDAAAAVLIAERYLAGA